MGRAPLALLLTLVALAPEAAFAAQRHARPAPHASPKARPAAARPPSALTQAQAAYAALLRDRVRRRYRHHWERAIAGLERAARGPDAGPALLAAARARYALYRWSADEADREKALALATRAASRGAGEGRALAAAIRREAGDDHPAPPHRSAPQKPPAAPGRAAPAAPAAPAAVAAAPGAAPSRPPSPEAAAASASTDDDEDDEDEGEDPALLAALEPPEVPSAPLAMGTSNGDGPATVSEVRAWSSPEYTRVAIYLSHWVGWQKQELPAAADRPRRLAIDLRPAELGRALVQDVGGAQVARVRAAQNDAGTVRVVLDLSGREGVSAFQLDDPPRLVLDVGAPVRKEASPAVATGPGVATPPARDASPTPATATPSPGTTAAAAGPPARPAGDTDTAVTLPPRVLAALEGVPRVPPDPPEQPGAAGPSEPPPAAAPAGPRNVQPEPGPEPLVEGQRPIRRIVVDAGHGGHDPGAIGPGRVREKDVTLAIARRLARKLRAQGFEVVLTRDGDRYVALEERTAIANTARGDLFVSVHANAHPRRAMNGIETYFLNVTDDRYARRLAARENGLDVRSQGNDVVRILTDLDAKASADASQRLARLVQAQVCGGVRSRIGGVLDLGVKSALFYVLLGARMPAVLVETGFISNKAEEKRLASEAYQDEVASSIAKAVVTFARSDQRVATN